MIKFLLLPYDATVSLSEILYNTEQKHLMLFSGTIEVVIGVYLEQHHEQGMQNIMNYKSSDQ